MAYKGLPAGVKQLVVNPDNLTTCATQYLPGKRYLIFGDRTPGTDQVRSGGCQGSRMAEHAVEDLQFLEAYRLGKATNSVHGRVLQWVTTIGRPRRAEDAPVVGALVELRSGDRVYTRRTPASGDFRFENIPAGRYTLSATLAPYVLDRALELSVPGVGCLERFPLLKAHTRVSGTLLTETGAPAMDMRVELLRKHRDGGWYSTYEFWRSTSARGEFSFEGVPDGDYLLGHEIWHDRPQNHQRYPTTFFPGVTRRTNATVLHLGPLQSITGLQIVLPKPHTSRQIQVRVVWPDGTAPAQNLLQLMDGDDLIQNSGFAIPSHQPPPHGGLMNFTGFAERSYRLNVRYWVDDLGGPVPHDQQRVARSEVFELAPGSAPASVKLVLTRRLKADDDH